MTELPLKAKVFCTDGDAGKSTAFIIDPVKQTVTHLVVELHSFDQHIVPLEHVVESNHDSITLDCTQKELSNMPSFTEVEYIGDDPAYPMYAGGEWESPYVTTFPVDPAMLETEKVPPGELAIHRGDPVQATDGYVGDVGEFVIDAESGHITHIVLKKGHLWGKREVTLALKLIEKVEDSIVYLNIDKDAVEQLPAVKIKRHYRWQKDD